MNNYQGVQLRAVPVPSPDLAMAVPISPFDISGLDKSFMSPSNNMIQMQKPMVSHQMFVTELPEMIFVDTRFISQQAALDQGLLTVVSLHGPLTDIEPEERASQKKSVVQTADVAIMAKESTADESTLTDNPNPIRDRGQQTESEVNKTKTIGIQCELDEMVEVEADSTATNKSPDRRKQFREFVLEKSYEHSNGNQECLVCGEIEDSEEHLMSHMALHWGPSGLCENCGMYFEHYKMLSTHICKVKAAGKRERKCQLQCPLYYCGIMLESTFELHDHINEHLRLYRYRCSSCRRRFMTLYELRKHREFRKRCSEDEQRNTESRVQTASRNSRIDRGYIYVAYTLSKKRVLIRTRFKRDRHLRRCPICRWHCMSSAKFTKHCAKCIKRFATRRRKKHERVTLPTIEIFNGH